MDDVDLHLEVYNRYISGQSYREIADDLDIGKSSVPAMVKRVTDGEFGEPLDEDADQMRGLAKTLDRNGWSPGEVMAWAALIEEAKAEGLDPNELASVIGVFAKASRGVCDSSEYLSIAARLARAEEAGGTTYEEILADYEQTLNAVKAAEKRFTKLSSEEEELGSRLGEMRQEHDDLLENLRETRHELAIAQSRVSRAKKEAGSAEKRGKAAETSTARQLKYKKRVEKETSILKRAKDSLIPEVKNLQTRRGCVQRDLDAEDRLLAEALSMRREAAAIVDKHLDQIQMAKDLVQLIAHGEFNPYGRLFHELYLAMAQADGTISDLESLAVSEGARERIRASLIRVLVENQKMPQETRDMLLKYTYNEKVMEAIGDA